MHVGGLGQTRGIDKSLCKIEIGNERGGSGAGFGDAGPTHDQRRAHGLFEDPAFVEPTVFAEIKSLVARVDHDGVFREAFLVQVIEHAADVFIEGFYGREVVVEVALITPAQEVGAGEFGGAELRVARLVIGVPRGALLGREAGWRDEFRVEVGEGFFDRHVLIALGGAATGVRVEQRRGLGINAVAIEIEVAQRRRPLAVRRLVLAHEEKRFGFVAIFEPLE